MILCNIAHDAQLSTLIWPDAPALAAERYVALCEKNVANQRAVIAELERDGHDTTGAREVLSGQEETRRLYGKDRNRVLKELGRA